MYELLIENNKGEVLNLSSSPNYTVYKITGLNPPKISVNRSVNATSDGSTVNSTRVESRNLVLYLTVNRDVERNRIDLYKYFPPKKPIKVYFKNGSREVYIEGYVELIECDLFTQRQIAQISIICPNPYFKAVDTLISYFSDITALFEFPFSIGEGGVEFSTSTPNIRKSIINTGDVDTGAIIQIYSTGVVVNPVIYDVNEQTHFKLNMTLQASDMVTINTNIGEKSVTLLRNGTVLNILGYMAQDSEFFVLESGDNVFTYGADSGANNLEITFTTALLYEGV